MDSQVEPILESLGLGGDGDEISAIEEVEQAFGVLLDVSDAGSWRTVGDVYSALLSALPPEHRESEDVWPRFAQAISGETGVDPTGIGPATVLLSLGGGCTVWLAFFLLIAVGTAIAIAARRW
ncbi:MAG: hypothetical protein ABIO86_10325 [Sphingomonas sp.]